MMVNQSWLYASFRFSAASILQGIGRPTPAGEKKREHPVAAIASTGEKRRGSRRFPPFPATKAGNHARPPDLSARSRVFSFFAEHTEGDKGVRQSGREHRRVTVCVGDLGQTIGEQLTTLPAALTLISASESEALSTQCRSRRAAGRGRKEKAWQ